MTYEVRYTDTALNDIDRIVDFLIARDPDTADRALQMIIRSTGVLETFPFSCRKADWRNPFLRELLVPFGQGGYVALFEIGQSQVTVLAIRSQREDDYFY